MGGSQAWSSQVIIANKVIIEGANDYLLVYGGTPGLGTLIVSIAAQAGVDQYGNAYPQGINVTTGTISGATFTGNDFVINSFGAFFYKASPAVNELITSIATDFGTDAYGNQYTPGVAVYDEDPSTGPVGYIEMIGQSLIIGNLNLDGSWQQQSEGAGSFFGSGSQVAMVTATIPGDANFNDQIEFSLLSGKGGSATASATVPVASLLDSLGTSAADFLMSGNMRRTTNSGTPLAKQTPGVSAPAVLGTGWSLATAGIRNTNPLRIWIDNNDFLHLCGSVATTSATPAGTVVTLSAPYLPVNNATFGTPQGAILQQTSAGAFKAMAHTFLNTGSGGLLSVNLATFAIGDIFTFDHHWPLGNLP